MEDGSGIQRHEEAISQRKMRLQNSLEIRSPWNPRSWSGVDYSFKKLVYTYTTLKISVGKLTNRGIPVFPLILFWIANRQSKNKRYRLPSVLTSPSHPKWDYAVHGKSDISLLNSAKSTRPSLFLSTLEIIFSQSCIFILRSTPRLRSMDCNSTTEM